MTSKKVFNKFPHTYVAFVDMLGVAEETKQPSLAQIYKGKELETVSEFISDLCRIYPKINAYGFSDSHVLISGSFDDLALFLIVLFQISGIVRDFRLRAGIEIGNYNDYAVKQPPANYTSLPILYGDALTGAVKAEECLKGSRITCGPSLSKCIEQKLLPIDTNLAGLLKKTILSHKEDWAPFENLKGVTVPVKAIDKYVYEVNWFKEREVGNIFKSLNKAVAPLRLNKRYAVVSADLLERRAKSWIEDSRTEPYYPQIMLGVLYSFGVLP